MSDDNVKAGAAWKSIVDMQLQADRYRRALEAIRDFMVDEEGDCTSCGAEAGKDHLPTYRCRMAADALKEPTPMIRLKFPPEKP